MSVKSVNEVWANKGVLISANTAATTKNLEIAADFMNPPLNRLLVSQPYSNLPEGDEASQ